MLLSVVSVLVVAQSSSEVPEGLMNNTVYITELCNVIKHSKYLVFADDIWNSVTSTDARMLKYIQWNFLVLCQYRLL